MSDERSTPRREFLGQVAASAIVLAGTACATPAASATQAAPAAAPPPTNNAQGAMPAMPPAPTTWDDSWFNKLTAKHKAVFDSPEINEGLVLAHASGYIRGMRDAISAGESDVQTVVVIRHSAVVMLLTDAMWQKYDLGKLRNVKEGSGDKFAVRNMFVGNASARPSGEGPDRPQPNLSWLATRGHIILGCDLAMRNLSGILARQTRTESRAVYDEMKANTIAGAILQPTGVYACHRAQEAGCSYIRST